MHVITVVNNDNIIYEKEDHHVLINEKIFYS